MENYIYCGIVKPTDIQKNYSLKFKKEHEENSYSLFGFDTEHDAKNASKVVEFMLKNNIIEI